MLFIKLERGLQLSTGTERLMGKFPAQTDDDVKEFMMAAFQNVSSSLRVLLATIAFGIGVDVLALHTVIHYGPPHDRKVGRTNQYWCYTLAQRDTQGQTTE